MLYTPISLENNTFLLTECKGHTRDIGPRLWQCGPSTARFVQNDLGQIFPSMAGASKVSKQFIKCTRIKRLYFEFAAFPIKNTWLPVMTFQQKRSVWQNLDQVRMDQNGPIYLRTVLPYNNNYYSNEDQLCLPCIKQSYL